MISTILVHKFSAFIFNEKHSFFYIYNSRYFVHLLIIGVFFNSLHSVAREFAQNMDVNAYLNPRVGMEFDTSEDACDFWVKYGRQMGFDVRKHYINKSQKDEKVISRGFVCAKQGIRGTEKEYIIHTRN